MTVVREVHIDAPGTKPHGGTFRLELTPGHDLLILDEQGSLIRLTFSGRHLDVPGAPEVWVRTAFTEGG